MGTFLLKTAYVKLVSSIKMIVLLLALAICNVNAEVALVIGGFGASDSVQVITKDDVCLGEKAEPTIPRAPDGRVGWTAQYIEGKVIVCGGAKVDFYSNCYSLKIGEQSWYEDGTMQYRRRYAESIVLNGEMIVMGGYNQNQGWLDAVERRQSDGQFVEMTDWKMPRKIFDFCAVQMDEDRIMLLGGNILGLFDSDDMDILDTKTNTWSKGPSMAKSRATHDCMLYEHNGENGVLVTGGCSQNCFYHLKDTSFFSFATETLDRIGSNERWKNGTQIAHVGWQTNGHWRI